MSRPLRSDDRRRARPITLDPRECHPNDIPFPLCGTKPVVLAFEGPRWVVIHNVSGVIALNLKVF